MYIHVLHSNCRLAESCLRCCSLSCAVSAANLRCWRCRRFTVCAYIVVAIRSWGGVYVIAGFTKCSRSKLLARADDVRYNWGEPERAPPRALQRLRSLSHNISYVLALVYKRLYFIRDVTYIPRAHALRANVKPAH